MIVPQLEMTPEEIREAADRSLLREPLTRENCRLMAERLNAILEEKMYCTPKLYGVVFSSGEVGNRWCRSPFTSTSGRSTHVGQLIAIRRHRGDDGEL